MNLMDKINNEQCRSDIAEFNIGDTVKVYSKIIEGKTERVQAFTGTVIAKNGSGIQETFTVRRVAFGQGMEKVYPINSPRLVKVKCLDRVKLEELNFIILEIELVKLPELKKKEQDNLFFFKNFDLQHLAKSFFEKF